ncbi:choice-of-anchor X domain-containing protein [Pseudoalteromonas sp. MSK9-3]|uniref:choice-of-anchor X domain-containing protein n=1 Tax=Pseudoalteromonas sp. MSK9-3 TaxID=1897633 RepID=UPI000E6D029B|nr:choice-of-anchor X domain-containing protein [Pseudoalteromonas sp. MSK9-3]
MINTIRAIVSYFLISLTASLCFVVAANNDVPLNMSTHKTVTQAIEVGHTQTTIPIVIDHAQTLALELIAPIEGVNVGLINPNGQTVINPNDPETVIIPGSEYQPGLPGATVILPIVSDPIQGVWQIILTYPEAAYKTIVIAKVLQQTSIAFGVAMAMNEFVVGESIPLAALLTHDGTGMTDGSVMFEVTEPSNTVINLEAFDTGQDIDHQAGDGIYSKEFMPSGAGEHIIKATAQVMHEGISVTRESSKRITVRAASIDINKVLLEPVLDETGCVTHVDQKVELFAHTAGEYAFNSGIYSGAERIREVKRVALSQGAQTVSILYEKEDLVKSFSSGAILTSQPLYVLKLEQNDNVLANARRHFESKLALESIQFCREAIEIVKDLTTTPVMSADGAYITALTFQFPVYVEHAGSYTGSVNISGVNGKRIDLVSFSKYLPQGDNFFEFTVSGEKFQKDDGPYTLNSLLVYTRGHSARLGELGHTPAYKKEDFIPKLNTSLTFEMIGLERNNWQGTQPVIQGRKRVGGYVRAGASIPYDYEVLSSLDMSHIKGTLIDASIDVVVGSSSLVTPFTQIDVFSVGDKAWNMSNVSYDHFCQSFTLCPSWHAQVSSFNATLGDTTYTLRGETVLNLLQAWVDNPSENNGIVFTSSPHERTYFIEITDVKVNLTYAPE